MGHPRVPPHAGADGRESRRRPDPLFLHGAARLDELGDGSWPEGVPLQVHTMADDDQDDVDVARELATAVPDAEVSFYPGDRHLFTDGGTEDHGPHDPDREVVAGVAPLVRRRPAPLLPR